MLCKLYYVNFRNKAADRNAFNKIWGAFPISFQHLPNAASFTTRVRKSRFSGVLSSRLCKSTQAAAPLPRQSSRAQPRGYVHLRPRRARAPLRFLFLCPFPHKSDTAAPASIAAAVISARPGSSPPPTRNPSSCTVSHADAAHASVTGKRLLVRLLATTHPVNAARADAVNAAAPIRSSPSVPFSTSTAVSASSANSATQHTSAPHAHFFTYHSVDIVCST